MSRDNYVVEFKRSAIKELTALDPKLRERIRDKIDALAENPRPRGAIKLKGNFDAWRIRVADYRIIYEIRDGLLLIVVLRVAKRSDAYFSN